MTVFSAITFKLQQRVMGTIVSRKPWLHEQYGGFAKIEAEVKAVIAKDPNASIDEVITQVEVNVGAQ